MNRRQSVLKVLVFGFAAMFALALAGIGALLAYEWRYISRLRTHPKRPITTVSWHQPKVAVAGGPVRDLPRISPKEAGIDPAALGRAAEYARAKNSCALLVLRNGGIVLEEYWQGHTREAWSDSASMAKAVTALLTGIAIAEGKIGSADEKAATHLPAWAGDQRRDITLRHLLQMRSGLRPMGDYTDPFSDACYLALGSDARYIVNGCPAVAVAGAKADYNNVNYQALGFVLEHATGRSLAEYLSEKLWKPLGNRDAALWLDRPGGSARAFGYLFATAEDWARVGLLIANGGAAGGRQIVPPEWVRLVCAPSPTDSSYGAGVYTAPDGDHPPFAAAGTVALNGKDKQRVYVTPSLGLVIVRIGEQAKKWDDSFLPNLIAEAIRNR